MNPEQPHPSPASTPPDPMSPNTPPVAEPITQQSNPTPIYNPLPVPRYDPAQVPGPQYAPTPQPQPQQQPVAPTPAYQTEQYQQEYSVDYLNRITPTVQKKPLSKFIVFGLIAALLCAVGLFLAILFSSSGSSLPTNLVALDQRIGTLKTVTGEQQKRLNESSISSANATLNSTLTTMQTDLAALAKARDIKLTISAKSEVKTDEDAYRSALSKKLENSYQRGTIDRTYAANIIYELTLLRTQLIKLAKMSNSQSIDQYSTANVKNIDLLLETLAEFSATK